MADWQLWPKKVPSLNRNKLKIAKRCSCISVENENHCDFVKLREMLIRTNMEDLRETTHKEHFELYRRHKLEHMGFSDDQAKRLDRRLCCC